ncbi:MAG: mechanosensitive ion channel [Synergistaceae bacterium]|nr:mechanosensitive ion channel [Synergistaceae bacterium]
MKKFLLAFILILAIAWPSFGADSQERTSDYVTDIQKEISSDIGKLRESINKELESIKLGSADISARIAELAALTEKSSDDMSAWGYNEEQRELHTRILSELSVGYAAYSALVQSSSTTTDEKPEDADSLGTIESPDINKSDSLRQEIAKFSREFDVQVFYLQSKLNKLRLDIREAANLQKQLKEAQEGGEGLELPRTHVLQLEAARVNVALTSLQVRAQKKAFDLNVAEIKRLRGRLESMQDKLIFPQELLDSNLEKLQTRITELTTELNEANKALDSAHSSLVRARVALGSSDMMPLTNESAIYLARSARVNYWEHMVTLLDDEIFMNREIQQVWRDRFKLFHDQASGEEIWKLRDSAQERIQELNRQLEGIRTMENTLLRQIENTQAQANTEGLDGMIQQRVLQAVENQRKIIYAIYNRYESLIPTVIFYQQRLQSEANENISAVRIAEKVSSFSQETIMNFLNTELWEGEGYSVTVGKLVIAILVFLSSFFLSSWGSHWIKRRMLKRVRASVTAANAVQRIVFYILWIAFALIALNILKIPLTAFAFMGGAIAVGLGFGMQNIFNNLISGFIVIFSRPFKVNDMIEVAGTSGLVEDIGSRSTTIRTYDGLDVILPNRYFLENSVTNWTRTDLKKREILKVGVAYDSDSRQVEKLLNDIVKEHSKVLNDPAPFVIFKNFGDDALEFEVYYWFELKSSSGLKISSDLRHHIAAVFQREGINIPYPQRDIHIINDDNKPKLDKDDEAKNV